MNSPLDLLDPAFLKAIRLLHSKSKETVDILKQMYDDSVAQKLGIKDHKSSSIIKQDNIFPPQKPSPKYSVNEGTAISGKGKKFDEINRKHDLGKRSDKFQTDSDPGLLPSEAKRIQIDSPRVSPVPNRNSSPTSNISEEKIIDSSDSNLEKNSNLVEQGKSPHQWVLELGLVCVVCRSIDVAPGNQLIECQECHSLYHQECHRPPAISHDVNDPRLVWYCSKCKKNLKKIATAPKPQKPTPKPSTSTSKESNTFSKAFKSDSFSIQHPFKRVESKTTFVTRSRLKLAVADATIVFNDEERRRVVVFAKLELDVTAFGVDGLETMDNKHLRSAYAAEQKAVIKARRARSKIFAARRMMILIILATPSGPISSSSSNKPVGLAGLAANINNKTLSSSSLSSTKSISHKSSKSATSSQSGSNSQKKGMASLAMSFKSPSKSNNDKKIGMLWDYKDEEVAAVNSGHTTEMLKLIGSMSEKYTPQIYVAAENDEMSVEKVIKFEKSRNNNEFIIERIPRSREVNQPWISTIFSTVIGILCSIPLIYKHKPNLILCNGPGTCIPICLVGILYDVSFCSY
ncbi:Integrator complex subunit 12 [Nymphon striatum]|nr:Integrator complex subunit 12 [Nymphon striatum]